MRLVAVTRILNEADIVEAFVRHSAALVDHHVLLDNGSTDRTPEILAALRAEGVSLELHHSRAVSFAESEQNNFLFALASRERGADWVLPLDADEFIDDRGVPGGLRAALRADGPDALKLRVREYIPTPADDPAELLVPARITHARAPTDNAKVVARAALIHRGADLQPGGHAIRVAEGEVPWTFLEGAVHAHYATRSPWQWITKFVIGWSKVLAAGPAMVQSGHSNHYREPFRVLKTAPADILRNPFFMAYRHNEPDLAVDPLPYRGAALRYTRAVDHQMRAVQVLMAHLESLSEHHGRLATGPGADGAAQGGVPG
jgi:hypothetical protein